MAHLCAVLLNQLHAAVLFLASLPALFGSADTGSDIPHDWFGGTLTECAPSNIPAGGSPRNVNVEFLPGMVRTRGGLQKQTSYSAIAGGPWQARWVDDYATAPESPSQMVMLTNPALNSQAILAIGGVVIGHAYGYGNQRPWITPPVIQQAANVDAAWTGPLAKACTQFGRKYIAISDGRYGYDLPRQWDGANYDRVSQCGPGLAPTAADDASTSAYTEIAPYFPAGLTLSMFEIGNTVYVAGAAPVDEDTGETLIQIGDAINISSAGVSAYDGTWPIFAVQQPYVLFTHPTSGLNSTTGTVKLPLASAGATGAQVGKFAVGNDLTVSGATPSGYDGAWPIRSIDTFSPTSVTLWIAVPGAWALGTSASGNYLNPGTISAGLHQVSVCFITRQGYITKPAPPSSWTAAGARNVVISNIPQGPGNVVGRLLIFTPLLVPPAKTGTFYSVRQTDSSTSSVMQINDNTTTTLTLNFSDSDLTVGFNAQYLFGLVELGECAGCFTYAGRIFWWGELNSMQDFLNMEFNGGWSLGSGTGGSDVPDGWTSDPTYGAGGKWAANGGVWLDAYRIDGTAVAAGTPQGMITQAAFQNYLGNPLLEGSTAYSMRVAALATSAAAEIVVEAYSPSMGILGYGVFGNFAATYSTEFVTGLGAGAAAPSDLLLRVYAVNVPVGSYVLIDRVQIYPTNQEINYTSVRASYASDPESFDGVTGLLQPIYSNGQAMRAMYTLRDSLYLVTDRGTFVTKDTGGEPATWTLDPVSAAVGCVGPNAAAAGEDWEVKVNRYGLYIYIGREPEKISQEIQSLWNKEGVATAINWAAGYKIWTTVDLQNKRVYVGAPTNGAVECNALFVLDYNFLDTSDAIAELPTLRFSAYTGRPLVLPQGRKWTTWTFANPAGGLLPVPCGAFVEQPGGVAQFLLGGAADSNVYFIDPTNRGNDNGQACTSSYATHFFPTSDEEQQLQLRSHMHGFSLGRFYVQGSGVMGIAAYRNTLSDANPKRASVNLRNPAPIDKEKTFDDFTAERYALEWTTSGLGSWFQMERMTRTVEMGPQLVRGTDLE